MVVDAADDDALVMDRRAFFRRGIERATRATVQRANEWANQRAGHWLRPPFALDELEFLLACTRCDACVEACPHDALFRLPARLGPQVAGTPGLDLLNKGCRLCEDWPCVASCQPGALAFGSDTVEKGPAIENAIDLQAPRPLAVIRIDQDRCLPYLGPECGACAESCPVAGALLWASAKPSIDPKFCLGCGLCREACITDPPAITVSAIDRSVAPAD